MFLKTMKPFQGYTFVIVIYTYDLRIFWDIFTFVTNTMFTQKKTSTKSSNGKRIKGAKLSSRIVLNKLLVVFDGKPLHRDTKYSPH